MPHGQGGSWKGPQGKQTNFTRLNQYQAYQLLRGGGPDLEVRDSLPPNMRDKLHGLFGLIEKEFEALYLENLSLHERLEMMSEKLENQSICGRESQSICEARQGHDEMDGREGGRTSAATKVFSASGYRLKSHTNKLKYQTNKIMSNLKPGSTVTVNAVRRYTGHKDGVWEVSVSRMGLPILGTVSADHSALVWGMHSGACLLQYKGHAGSVNSIRFHPTKELVLTASGDGTAHIWQCAVNLYNESSSGRVASSEDELDPTEREFLSGAAEMEDAAQFSVLRTPLRALSGHSGVVIAADWLPGGEQVVSAGWDRLACVWDTQTGEQLQQLSGHDDELTSTSAHATQRLLVTSSKDSTFRLWDFRETIHSVSVFQGHQDTVTSAVFAPNTDLIVSGSDDRTCKVWDLRNMRTPVATIHSDAAMNRLSVSTTGVIAIPYDNRNIRLYDLQGNRVARLPRSTRQGHARMVCSTAWAEDYSQRPNLFTCGFDRAVIGWSVQPRDTMEDKDGFRLNLSLRGKDSSLKEHLHKDPKEPKI